MLRPSPPTLPVGCGSQLRQNIPEPHLASDRPYSELVAVLVDGMGFSERAVAIHVFYSWPYD